MKLFRSKNSRSDYDDYYDDDYDYKASLKIPLVYKQYVYSRKCKQFSIFQNSDTCSCGLPWRAIGKDREEDNMRHQFPWQVYIERLVENEDDSENFEYQYEYEDYEGSAEKDDDEDDEEISENNGNVNDLSLFRSLNRIKRCIDKKRKGRQGGNAERLRRSFQQQMMVENRNIEAEQKKELTSPLLEVLMSPRPKSKGEFGL